MNRISPAGRLASIFPARLLAALCLVLSLWSPNGAQAQSAAASAKMSADLSSAIGAPSTPLVSFAKDVAGVRMVKVLIVSSSQDPDLTALRADVLQRGGAVHMRFVSVTALAAMLPANQVAGLAERADVQSISANRLMARSSSTLESVTGALGPGVRSYTGADYTGLDGSGVGVAVLDSGIDTNHRNFKDAGGTVVRVPRAIWTQLSGTADWTAGVDLSASLYPGSDSMQSYEAKLASYTLPYHDSYGHGTAVASVLAGRGAYQGVDSSGMAPNASLFDITALGPRGFGQLAHLLAGIDWAIYHAKEYNIRVLNLSLATDSSESHLTDPLCRAVRSATAAGITVVAAAGNFGNNSAGAEVYGAIGSPGHCPTVITVGSVNSRGTLSRADDVVNNFSSRGPTRGSSIDAAGVKQIDNLLKPDLVAPGNKIVSALAADKFDILKNYLSASYPQLSAGLSTTKAQRLMTLSGTSIAAPAVAGTVALMLQANPGLTPPLIKAILQYTAQPLAGASLLQQGAGQLNVEGAVRLAAALRTDIKTVVEAGTLNAGAAMLASGKTMPTPTSTINGETFNWSRIAYVGGNQIVSGSALFTKYQPAWDHRLMWARGKARRSTVSYWPAGVGVAANTYIKSIVDAPAGNQGLLTAGVVTAGALAGSSSLVAKTGAFLPTANLAQWLAAGSGKTLSQGFIVSEGVILSEGFIVSEGFILSEGFIVSEGFILSEGFIVSEGFILSESGSTAVPSPNDTSLLGEP